MSQPRPFLCPWCFQRMGFGSRLSAAAASASEVCAVCLGLLQDKAVHGVAPPRKVARKKRQAPDDSAAFEFSEGVDGVGAGVGVGVGAGVGDGAGVGVGVGVGAGAGAGAGFGAAPAASGSSFAGAVAGPTAEHASILSSTTAVAPTSGPLPRLHAAIQSYVREMGYEGVRSFCVLPLFPPAIRLREHLLAKPGRASAPYPPVRDIVLGVALSAVQAAFSPQPTSVRQCDAELVVSVRFHHEDTLPEVEAAWRAAYPDRRKRQLGPEGPNMSKMLPLLAKSQLPPMAATSRPVTWSISCLRAPQFIRGRYLKLQRGIPQSMWMIDGERRGQSSVHELVGMPVAQRFKTGNCKFHSAGREDADVRMLGSGRPFVLELVDARLPVLEADVPAVAAVINGATDAVQVLHMELGDKSCMSVVQDGAESKRKKYACVVWVQRAVTNKDLDVLRSMKELVLSQRTPVRVMHRRAMLDRPKVIHDMQAVWLNAHYFELRVTTSAGTYVKEFVHGDLGRTEPNVGTLLHTEADILQLDVCDLIM